MHRRLTQQNFSRRFACFTFDDGYRDNRDFALPAMREYDAPFTVYVANDFANGSGHLWWVALERVIASTERIDSMIGDTAVRLDTRTVEQKQGVPSRLPLRRP
jgi:peptidoglycan/xylan/chitin deacetylase (PgdA/CDA1 family)